MQEITKWFDAPTPWVIVDQMSGPDTLYSTHYFCGTCCADLSALRVHHVFCCPYCGGELPNLLNEPQRSQPHMQCRGPWPYDMLSRRFPSWCTYLGFAPDAPEMGLPNGWVRREMSTCRLLEGHEGDHRFGGDRQHPPRNPIREWATA